jgi:hypothetical protein
MQNNLRKVEKIPELGPVPFISSLGDEKGFSVNEEVLRVLEQESRKVNLEFWRKKQTNFHFYNLFSQN